MFLCVLVPHSGSWVSVLTTLSLELECFQADSTALSLHKLTASFVTSYLLLLLLSTVYLDILRNAGDAISLQWLHELTVSKKSMEKSRAIPTFLL